MLISIIIGRENNAQETNGLCRFLGGDMPKEKNMFYTWVEKRRKVLKSTPEPKPDTTDTHVLLDGNLGVSARVSASAINMVNPP